MSVRLEPFRFEDDVTSMGIVEITGIIIPGYNPGCASIDVGSSARRSRTDGMIGVAWPRPATILLAGLGLGALCLRRRR